MAHQCNDYDEEKLRALIAINREAIRKLQEDVEHYSNLLQLTVLQGTEAPKIFNSEAPHPSLPPEPPAGG